MDILLKIERLKNHLKAKNFALVINECEKLIRKNPNNSFLYNLCGLALQGNKNIATSIDYFHKAIDLEPSNVAAKNNLANSYKHIGKLSLAENLYKEALVKNPNHLQTLNNYGNLKTLINDYDSAIDLYNKALKVEKNMAQDIAISFSLASAYQSTGNLKKAIEISKKIILKNPKFASAHKFMSALINYKDNKEHLEQMLEILKDENLSKDQLIDFSFALGKAYEDLKDYENSFINLKKGNKLKKEKLKYDFKNEEKLFNSIISAFKDIKFEEIKRSTQNKEKIIFICGMPRSGTTLVEQIIATHKDVSGAGELIYLQNAVKKNLIEEKSFVKKKLVHLINSMQNIIENEYLEMLNMHKIKNKVITDKAPQNFRWIGIIKIFFPNSKIIHCTRNSKDNCLSLFKNNFASIDMGWAYDESDISNYYNLYRKLMEFWKLKLGDSIYEINYEKIVSNKESEIKKLINFCELKWDTSCLNHHKNNKTPIKTVSVAQARKPIYSTSVKSADHYKKFLKKMYSLIKN